MPVEKNFAPDIMKMPGKNSAFRAAAEDPFRRKPYPCMMRRNSGICEAGDIYLRV